MVHSGAATSTACATFTRCHRAHRDALFGEIERVSVALQEITRPDKINVAALGNMVPQLHIHVIARHSTDIAWPSPVWSVPGARPYPDPQPLIAQLRSRLCVK